MVQVILLAIKHKRFQYFHSSLKPTTPSTPPPSNQFPRNPLTPSFPTSTTSTPNPPHQTPITAPTKPPPSFAPPSPTCAPPIPNQVTSANPPRSTSYPHTHDPPASCQLPLASPPNDRPAIRALAKIGEMLGGGDWLTRVRFFRRFFPFKKSCTYHPVNIYASTSVPLLVCNFLGTKSPRLHGIYQLSFSSVL